MGSPTQARTVAERVTDALRTRILAGQYEPGAPLRQDAVAADLGVSRIPLREALNHLEGEGLVASMAHRGFIVRPMSRNEVAELFALRLRLAPAAISEGATIASALDQDNVQRLLGQLKSAGRQNNAAAVCEHSHAIAIALTAPSQRPVVARVLLRLQASSQRYIIRYLNGRGGPDIAEFERLCAVWQDRNADEAAAIVTQQLTRMRDRVLEAFVP